MTKKGIAGNNRTVQATDKLFSTSSKYGELWLGLGKDGINNSSIKGAGFKIYLLKNGIIATMLVFCLYWLLMPRKCDKRYAYSFLVLMTLIFLQKSISILVHVAVAIYFGNRSNTKICCQEAVFF